MSNLYIQAQTLTDIADAIREKAGTSATMTPSQMVSAIGSISGGDTTLEDGLVTGVLSSYENSRVSYVRSYAFYQYDNLMMVSLPKVVDIQYNAFNNCLSLSTINFPKVTTIDSCAFSSCKALVSTSFPAVTFIGSRAFQTCTSLEKINFPLATSISASAFGYCYSLNTASFPTVEYIGNYTFYRCYDLLSLYLLGSSVPTLADKSAFYSTPIAGYTTPTGGVYGSIYVPASLYSSYITATNWATYSSRFVSV